MTNSPAKDPGSARYYWCKTPHAAGPEVLSPAVFDRLPGGTPDAAAHYSAGAVARRFYPSAAAALAAAESAVG